MKNRKRHVLLALSWTSPSSPGEISHDGENKSGIYTATGKLPLSRRSNHKEKTKVGPKLASRTADRESTNPPAVRSNFVVS